jgi:hypothetical protein
MSVMSPTVNGRPPISDRHVGGVGGRKIGGLTLSGESCLDFTADTTSTISIIC